MAVIAPPFKLLIVASGSLDNRAELLAGLLRAFRGGKDDGSYLASGPELQVESQTYDSTPSCDPDVELDTALHTMVLAVVDQNRAADDSTRDWLERSSIVAKLA